MTLESLLFSLREHKTYAAYNPVFTFTKPSASIIRVTTTNASMGKGYIFIVVPRAWLNEKYIRWRWQGYASAALAGFNVLIYDGEYNRSSDTDFPSGSAFPIKGAGLLQTLASKTGSFAEENQDVQVDVSAGTEDNCTIFFQLGDGWSTQNLWVNIDWFEINGGSGGSDPIFDEQFTDDVHMEVTGTYGDYGYISGGEAGPAPPTVLTVGGGVKGKTEVLLEGNITTPLSPTPCDERGFEWGTTSGVYPYSWTEVGSFGTGVFSHQLSGLEEGTTYYFRAKAHNAEGWGYGAEKSFTPSECEIEGRLSDVDPPAPEPLRTIYRDIVNLPDPVKLGLTLHYFNHDAVGLYFKITGSGTGYTFGDVELGLLASGENDYINLDEFASKAKPSPGELPDGELEETITLTLTAYTDAGYTDLKWIFERVVTVYWINSADAAFTVDVLNNFDDGTSQTWSCTVEEGTISCAVVSDYVLSAPYSYKMTLYHTTQEQCRGRFDKSLTTPNKSKVFGIIDVRVGKDPGSRTKNLKIKKNDDVLVLIGRPYDGVMANDMPYNKWMRIVVPLPQNTALTLRVLLEFWSYHADPAHRRLYAWLDDFKIISKD